MVGAMQYIPGAEVPQRNPMDFMKRLRILGIVLAAAGLAVAGFAFAYGVPTAQSGLDSAQAMYADQGVTLSYNDDGELLDRGTPEGAQRIMALLEDTWRYPVDESNFDPNDPLVDTRDELMYQYAVIVYHVYHGQTTVTLGADDVPITYRGVTYEEAGDYEIAPMAYYAELDRNHVIEGQLRSAWSPLALSLTAYLSSGHANQAAGELAFMTSLDVGGIGLLFVAAGGGLVWATASQVSVLPGPRREPAYEAHLRD